MAKKCKCPPQEPGVAGWVVTYGDMMSLLLTFFILLLSFSSIQESKFKMAMESLQSALGMFNNTQDVIDFEKVVVPREEGGATEEMLYEFRQLEQYLLEEGLDGQVEVSLTNEGIQIKIEDEFLFSSGRAELQNSAGAVLDKISGFLDGKPNAIEVSGHTDSLPIHTARFPSNWELSAARAIAVARRMQDTGIHPSRMRASGFGEYRPIADNGTPDGRAKNRRVEIFMTFDERANNGTGDVPMPASLVESEG